MEDQIREWMEHSDDIESTINQLEKMVMQASKNPANAPFTRMVKVAWENLYRSHNKVQQLNKQLPNEKQ